MKLFFALWIGMAAGAATLLWDANAPCERVTNYIVHSGPASRSYTGAASVGTNTSFPLPTNAGFYAVSAQGAFGESALSAEVLYVPAPEISRVKLRIFSKDLLTGEWHEFAAIPLAGTNGSEFFQMRISP